MKPIYQPKGAAKEYGDYALNIYTGCPHRCYYCFAPNVLHRQREEFHSHVEPRKDIYHEVAKQLIRENITGKLVHLCFTCDPYPTDCDTIVTRDIIKLLKNSGNHVQILTKGYGHRDFDLLGSGDWYGVTISCNTDIAERAEPKALNPYARLLSLAEAKETGAKTWVSFEPVLDDKEVLRCIKEYHTLFDRVKIGKLNYWPSDISWADFGQRAEALCKELGLDYYIKESLRREMEKAEKVRR